MTCIVAIKRNGVVSMAGDSAGSSGNDIVVRKDPKVFEVDESTMIGFCGSFRMGQILMNYLVMPPREEGLTDYRYICTSFITVVRQLFSEHGYMKKDGEQEEGGFFLVVYRGEIYSIESDFQVGVHVDDFVSIGSGSSYAMGALAVLSKEKDLSAEEILVNSLEVAESYTTSVRAPFNVITKEFS